MNHDMIERYLYAAAGRMPKKSRADVQAELRGLIEDMLAARCGDASPTDADVRAVLEKLGPPTALAERYAPDAGKNLIGPPYYTAYKFMLRIVLLSVVGGITISQVVLGILGDLPAPWWQALGQWFGVLLSGLAFAFAFVTVLFAIFQRRGVSMPVLYSLDDLPEVPKEKESVSVGESIFSIILSVLFAIVLLAAPQIFGYYDMNTGAWASMFNPDYVRSCWPIILSLCAIGIAIEAFTIYEGRHTMRLALVSVIANVLSLALFLAFFLGGNVMNPVFLQSMQGLFAPEDSIVLGIFTNLPYILLAIITFALALDTATTFWKAHKYGK